MLPPFGRIGLAGSWSTDKRDMIPRGTCNLANGDIYQFPNASSTIDGTQPLTFKWNTDCDISTTTIDLYLYSGNSANGLIQAWTGAPYSSGEYTVNLQPKWWNNTVTARLQMNIVQSGHQVWDAGTGPAGPVFTVNYPASAMTSTATSATATASQSGDAIIQQVSNTNQSSGISKGAIAAAVIVPILVIAALVAVAVRFWRLREKEKRRRWSQAMSSHSNLEWEKGALPGEKQPRSSLGGRPSMASGRPSMSHRPASIAASSVLASENMAGAGAAAAFRPQLGLRSASADHISGRSSLVMPDGQVRQSRISFAEAARPERQSRNSMGGEARPNIYHLRGASRSTNDITPLRKAYGTGSAIEDEDINVSPSQMQGPGGFADSDMRRVAKGGKTGRRSFFGRRDSQVSAVSAEDFKSAASARGSQDELRDMEAVMLARRSMMSTKSSPAPDTDDTEALSPMPSPHMPSAPSPIVGSSTVAYGPDQLLAVYATRAKSSPGLSPTPSIPTAGVALPKPSQSKMRLLTGLKRDKSEKNVPTISAPLPSPGYSEGSRYDDDAH